MEIATDRTEQSNGAANAGEPTHAERHALAADFPPLAKETRTHVPTEAAAHYLSRRPQTLRGWACREDGPIRPHRVNGRLLWPVAGLLAVLGVEGSK